MSYEEAIIAMQQARVASPALVQYAGMYHAFSRTKHLGSGNNYRAALINAGLLPLPARAERIVPFGVEDADVFRGEDLICNARSHNYALRIANALNAYKPGPHGY
jgi:hypothetical protein